MCGSSDWKTVRTKVTAANECKPSSSNGDTSVKSSTKNGAEDDESTSHSIAPSIIAFSIL